MEQYIEFIKKKHGEQKRIQGTPYYLHPVAVSYILAEKGFSEEYQMAGLFHDLLEDTDTTYEEIEALSNDKVAEAVRLVTKEKGYSMENYISRIKQNDMARMVKLADRIHNLSEAYLAPTRYQKEWIEETKEWYVELAKETVFEEDLKKVLNKLQKNIAVSI